MRSYRCLLPFILFLAIFSSNMSLAETVAKVPHKKVAILLFDGADIIDFSGPYDVFVSAEMDVFTVSAEGKPITTTGGMKVVPDYSYATAPDADAVLIPGGDTHKVQDDVATLSWIRQRRERGNYLMSVCNGAFTLANTGLLKGMRVTTTAGNIDALRSRHPDLNVVADARVVDNGPIITTGGLSAGIDGALHLVSRLKGMGNAQRVAQVMEYNWVPEGGFLPAQNAFHVMHQTIDDDDLAGFGHLDKLFSTSGDARHWSYVWYVRSDLESSELANRIDQVLAGERKKMNMNPPYAASSRHQWTFADTEGRFWTEQLDVHATPHDQHLHAVKLSVVRIDAGAGPNG
ncbi:DJ-1/PfpI family protein [Massilia sp. 9096]|uniref:DJ-1/PfpI family protein n=1 Tax=Massilia sp. 9096 TaxID=1500894 RepID=UPI0018CF9393|nr:DJ-1/PfpI family protein [Massilia sp. 9096]